MKKFISFLFFGITCTTIQAQQINNMHTHFKDSHVEITYTLKTNAPVNIELLYSTDRGHTFQICYAVTGNLQFQTSGNKKIIWECAEDGVILADVVLKLNIKKENNTLGKTDKDLIKMVFVEGGTFLMGCTVEQDGVCHNDEKPAHPVRLNSFYIGKYTITQGQWKAVMGNNPSYFAKGDNYPVDNVSWEDAQEFIRQLNKMTGKSYRLPTEAEWEYAARGGKKSHIHIYSGSDRANEVSWNESNSDNGTHLVGSKSPNELGIYDMSGNLWEWCNDWFAPYPASTQTNPTGPSSGTYRVLRGGSWKVPSSDCRVSYRYDINPNDRYYSLGFRVVHP